MPIAPVALRRAGLRPLQKSDRDCGRKGHFIVKLFVEGVLGVLRTQRQLVRGTSVCRHTKVRKICDL